MFKNDVVHTYAAEDHLSAFAKQKESLRHIIDFIKKNTDLAQDKQMYYDRRIKRNRKVEENFKLGEKVLILDIRGKRTKGGSLMSRFKGPFIIDEITKAGNVKLESLSGQHLPGVHKRKIIKRYVEAESDITLSAASDQEESSDDSHATLTASEIEDVCDCEESLIPLNLSASEEVSLLDTMETNHKTSSKKPRLDVSVQESDGLSDHNPQSVINSCTEGQNYKQIIIKLFREKNEVISEIVKDCSISLHIIHVILHLVFLS